MSASRAQKEVRLRIVAWYLVGGLCPARGHGGVRHALVSIQEDRRRKSEETPASRHEWGGASAVGLRGSPSSVPTSPDGSRVLFPIRGTGEKEQLATRDSIPGLPSAEISTLTSDLNSVNHALAAARRLLEHHRRQLNGAKSQRRLQRAIVWARRGCFRSRRSRSWRSYPFCYAALKKLFSGAGSR